MPKLNILIVDDEDGLRELIRDTLAIGNYNIFTATDGKDAWEKLNVLRPALVITDVEMPEMDGCELCNRIKNDPAFCKIPVLMLTVRNKERDEIKGLAAGADDYIAKPFKPALLMARVLALLRRYEADRGEIPRLAGGEPPLLRKGD